MVLGRLKELLSELTRMQDCRKVHKIELELCCGSFKQFVFVSIYVFVFEFDSAFVFVVVLVFTGYAMILI